MLASPPMQTKYELVNRMLRGRLPYELSRRRERGDSFVEIAFWLRSTHGIEVSYETIRQWCLPVAQDQDEAAV